LDEYIECNSCKFVLQAASSIDPLPKNWDSCPDCGGTDFSFIDK